MIAKTCEEYVLMELAAAEAKIEKLESELVGARSLIKTLMGKLRAKEEKTSKEDKED